MNNFNSPLNTSPQVTRKSCCSRTSLNYFGSKRAVMVLATVSALLRLMRSP